MKSIFFIPIFFISLCGMCQTKPKVDTLKKSQDNLTWNGKKITRKALEDSLRVQFFRTCECVDTLKKKKKA